MFSRATQMLSSLRSHFTCSTEIESEASSLARAGLSLSFSTSVIAGSSAILNPFTRQPLVPVQHALLPYIEEAGEHDQDVHQRFGISENARVVFVLKFPEDDRPRVHEHGFH